MRKYTRVASRPAVAQEAALRHGIPLPVATRLVRDVARELQTPDEELLYDQEISEILDKIGAEFQQRPEDHDDPVLTD